MRRSLWRQRWGRAYPVNAFLHRKVVLDKEVDDLTHAGIAPKAERAGRKSHRRQPETIVSANRHGPAAASTAHFDRRHRLPSPNSARPQDGRGAARSKPANTPKLAAWTNFYTSADAQRRTASKMPNQTKLVRYSTKRRCGLPI
jgi:hypothetical protein